METKNRGSRRNFLQGAALAGLAAFWPGATVLAEGDPEGNGGLTASHEVTPVEDLMREHGALNRILLIYEEIIRRLRADESFDWRNLKRAADLIHRFIEGYHEKLEEEFLFPQLEKAGRLTDIVKVLKIQHAAGRTLTERVIAVAGSSGSRNASDRHAVQSALESFIRMYRPHEAREDTVVFPEFKKLITVKQYDALGERFEDREHELFGKAGFGGVVAQIADIEKSMGIGDLSKFTSQ